MSSKVYVKHHEMKSKLTMTIMSSKVNVNYHELKAKLTMTTSNVLWGTECRCNQGSESEIGLEKFKM